MDKKEKELLRHQEDKALNRALCWVGGAMVLEFILLMLKKYYVNFQLTDSGIELANLLQSLLKGARMVFPVVFAAAIVWLVVGIKQHKNAARALVLTVVSAVLAVCAHVTLAFGGAGLQMLFLMVPVLGGLAFVYYIYQKEFFLAALGSGLSILGMWFIRFREGLSLELILTLAAAVLVLVFTMMVKKRGGMLPFAAETEFLGKNANYKIVLASLLVGLACVLISLFAGAVAAYYLIFLMSAWLFVLLVYYTVKLM